MGTYIHTDTMKCHTSMGQPYTHAQLCPAAVTTIHADDDLVQEPLQAVETCFDAL